MIEKLPDRPLSPGLKITDEEIYNKIQELIDAHNELEANTLDSFNRLLAKLKELL